MPNHAVKPAPDREFPQAQSAHDNFWDFISLTPEGMHMIMWVMSDRAIPRSFRFMEGFGVHTFRFLDGPQADTIVRTMKLDGADAPTLKLFIAITDGAGAMLTSDGLPDPFPTVDIANKNNFNISHTFSLQDSGGTLLMQLDSLVNQ